MRMALSEPRLATQILPSASTATPVGVTPTGMVASRSPSLLRRVTVLLPELATQMLSSAVTATPRELPPPVGKTSITEPSGRSLVIVLSLHWLFQTLPSRSRARP